MTFDSSAGSTGKGKMRLNPVTRWMQQRMESRVRRKGGKFMGMNVLILHTVGRKSGQPRESVVSWFSDGDGVWLIVASAGGSANNPDWFHNVAAHPDQVSIELPSQGTFKVSAEQLQGEQRDAAWSRITQEQPRYAKYVQKTDRAIPVLRLTRAA